MRFMCCLAWVLYSGLPTNAGEETVRRPNILIAISDDHSHPHTSAAGCREIHTPGFDRVASEGVLFTNAYAAAPGCSPSRAALLTGRHIWQIEEAGSHLSGFPLKYPSFPDLLQEAGYAVGYTGKPWSPGNWKVSGRKRNPAGEMFREHKLVPPSSGIWNLDYTANFEAFLKTRSPGQPFCFWYGSSEPHRDYQKGIGVAAGKNPDGVAVPSFLPDRPEIRSDLLDYFVEIEWYDRHLLNMIRILEAAGELDNTLIIATGDNGMPFPRAKATCYDFGIHVPLAIRWGSAISTGRKVDDAVGFVDLTATILEATGVAPPTEHPPSGRSLMLLLKSDKQGLIDPQGSIAWSGRERHSSSRYENRSYPQRALRLGHYLYIRNFKPERWPAGAPQRILDDGSLGPEHAAYHDMDVGPSTDFLIAHREDPEIGRFFQMAVGKRPAEELFDVVEDPGCLRNLVGDPQHEARRKEMEERMMAYLKQTGDPRVMGNGDVWESYKRYSNIRRFPKPEGE